MSQNMLGISCSLLLISFTPVFHPLSFTPRRSTVKIVRGISPDLATIAVKNRTQSTLLHFCYMSFNTRGLSWDFSSLHAPILMTLEKMHEGFCAHGVPFCTFPNQILNLRGHHSPQCSEISDIRMYAFERRQRNTAPECKQKGILCLGSHRRYSL